MRDVRGRRYVIVFENLDRVRDTCVSLYSQPLDRGIFLESGGRSLSLLITINDGITPVA